METMKVMPWGDGQGDFVVINVEDFDPAKHQKYEVAEDAPKRRARQSKSEQE